jgi:hypothetical protein
VPTLTGAFGIGNRQPASRARARPARAPSLPPSDFGDLYIHALIDWSKMMAGYLSSSRPIAVDLLEVLRGGELIIRRS